MKKKPKPKPKPHAKPRPAPARTTVYTLPELRQRIDDLKAKGSYILENIDYRGESPRILDPRFSMSNMWFHNCSFHYVVFSGFYLSECRFDTCEFRECDFYHVPRNVQFWNCRFIDTHLSAPSMLLGARWGRFRLSPSLTRELMRYDAANHPDPERFIGWAKDGMGCPYTKVPFERAAYFQEKRRLYSPGPAKSALWLMLKLFKQTGNVIESQGKVLR